MVAGSTASRKAKGRNLQQFVVATILRHFPALKPGDVVNTSMGAQGVDVKLSPAALELLPLAIECKNVEKINIWAAWGQATANSRELNPVLIFKRSRQKPLVVVDLSYFLGVHVQCDALGKKVVELQGRIANALL